MSSLCISSFRKTYHASSKCYLNSARGAMKVRVLLGTCHKAGLKNGKCVQRGRWGRGLFYKVFRCWKRLGARGKEGDRMRWLDGITDSMDMGLSKFCEMVKGRDAWCAAVHGVTKTRTRLSDWTTMTSNVNTKALHHILLLRLARWE